MKRLKRYLASILCGVMIFNIVGNHIPVYATVSSNDITIENSNTASPSNADQGDVSELDELKEIIDFIDFDETLNKPYKVIEIAIKEKENIENLLPDTLKVKLNDESEVDIDVSWQCKEDFTQNDIYSFTFNLILPNEYKVNEQLLEKINSGENYLPFIGVTIKDNTNPLVIEDMDYDITLVYNNGNENEVILANYLTDLPIPEYEGYTFIDWYTDEECTIAVTEDDLDFGLILYAKWEKNQVNINLVYNNGAENGTIAAAYLSDITDPTYDGYVFTGWFTDEALSIKATDDSITDGITLYAGWNIIDVQYIDGDEDGKGNDSNSGLTVELPVKTLAKAYENLSKNGGTIYIVGTISIDEDAAFGYNYYTDQSINIVTDNNINIVKHSDITAFYIKSNATLQVGKEDSEDLFDISGGDKSYSLFYIEENGVLDLYNTIVHDNNNVASGFSGGAIVNDGKINIYNSTIRNNISGPYGGAIHNSKTGVLNMYSGIIQDNEAIEAHVTVPNGAAIYNKGIVNILDGEITGNKCINNSYEQSSIYSEGTLNITYCNIHDNNSMGISSTGELNIERIILNKNTYYGLRNLGNGEINDIICTNTINSGNQYGGRTGIYNSGVLKINTGDISYNNDGINNDGILETNLVDVNNNKIGVKNYNKFTMNGGFIQYNSSTSGGAGVTNYGTFILNDGKISNNTSYDAANSSYNYPYGAGVYNTTDISTNKRVVFEMTGGEISHNSSGEYNNYTGKGAGVYCDNNTTLTITGGKFIGNSSDYGAAVYIAAGNTNTAIIENVECLTNSSRYGAALYILSPTNIDNVKLSNNTAEKDGGAIWSDTDILISNSTIYGNSAENGGGLFGTGEIHDSKINNNDAQSDGGGIHGTFNIYSSSICDNSAQKNGGGIFDKSNSILIDTEIKDNEANLGSGAYSYSNHIYFGGSTSFSNNNTYIGSSSKGIMVNSELTHEDVVTDIQCENPYLGRQVVEIEYTIDNNLVTGDKLINKFTTSDSFILRPGNYVGDSKNIKDNSIIYSNLFNLKYNNNSIYASNIPSNITAYWCEETYVDSTIPKATDYVFKNWNTNSKNTGTEFEPGSMIMLTSDTNLYAIWEIDLPYNCVYVSYRNGSNSLSGANPSIPVKSLSQAYKNLKHTGGIIFILDQTQISSNLTISDTYCIESGVKTSLDDGLKVKIRRYSVPSSIETGEYYISGYEGTSSNTGHMIYIPSGKTLTLEGITIDGHGQDIIEGEEWEVAPKVESSGSLILNYGNLIINSGTLQNNLGNSAITNMSSSTLNMTGGTIQNNTGTNGGGIYNNTTGTLSITGGYIKNNSATYGGGIYHSVVKSTLDLNGVTLENNTASQSGGAIYTLGTLNIDNCNILNNMGKSEYATTGGAIYSKGSGAWTIKEINGTWMLRYDGTGVVNISNSTIGNNSATYGGAIYSENSQININDGTVIDTNSATSGAGIYAAGNRSNNYIAELNLNKGSITNNISKNKGGAIYSDILGIVNLYSTEIKDNEAKLGSGIYSEESNVNLFSKANIDESNNICLYNKSYINICEELENEFVSKLSIPSYSNSNCGNIIAKILYSDSVLASKIYNKFSLDNTEEFKLRPGDYVDESISSVSDQDIIISKEFGLYYKADNPNITGLPLEEKAFWNESINVSDVIPTYQDYKFSGWNTQADESGSYYLSGSKILLTDNTDLYAIFAPDYIYVDGSNGNNSNNGQSPDNSLKTLAKAYEKLQNTGGVIYITGQITVSGECTISKNSYTDRSNTVNLADGTEIRIVRYSQPSIMLDDDISNDLVGYTKASYTGRLFYVNSSSAILNLKDITIDGHKDAVTSGKEHEISSGASGTIIYVSNSSADLNINGCQFKNNSGSVITSYGNINIESTTFDNIKGNSNGIVLLSTLNAELNNITITNCDNNSSRGFIANSGELHANNITVTNSVIKNGIVYTYDSGKTSLGKFSSIDNEIVSDGVSSGAYNINNSEIILQSDTVLGENFEIALYGNSTIQINEELNGDNVAIVYCGDIVDFKKAIYVNYEDNNLDINSIINKFKVSTKNNGYALRPGSLINSDLVNTDEKDKVIVLSKQIELQVEFLPNSEEVINLPDKLTLTNYYGEVKNINLPLNIPTLTASTFLGWTEYKNGLGVVHNPGDSISISENIKLYAKWDHNNITVSYNLLNGETDNNKYIIYNNTLYSPLKDVNVSVKYNNAQADSTIISSNIGDIPIPTKDGYYFNGWRQCIEEATTIEINDFESITSNYPWVQDSDGVWYSGNNGVSSSSSSMKSNIFSVKADANLSFEWRSNGESCCDYLSFNIYDLNNNKYVNGNSTHTFKNGLYTTKNKASTEFTKIEYTLQPGTYFIEFIYGKDGSVDSNEDKGFVKNIRCDIDAVTSEVPDLFTSDITIIAQWEENLENVTFNGYKSIEEETLNLNNENIKAFKIESKLTGLDSVQELLNIDELNLTKNGAKFIGWTLTPYESYNDTIDYVNPKTDNQRLVELVPELADSDQEITLYALYANYDKIYIDSINGDNNNSGLVADKAIKTLSKAYELLSSGGTIYSVGDIMISDTVELNKSYYKDSNTEITLADEAEVSIIRYSQPTAHSSLTGYTSETNIGNIIWIGEGYSLTLGDITIDGHNLAVETGEDYEISSAVTSTNPIIYNNGTLNINGSTLVNNTSSNNGGAIVNKGTINISGITATNNIAPKGSSVDNQGVYRCSGTMILDANNAVNLAKDTYIQPTGVVDTQGVVINITYESPYLGAIVANVGGNASNYVALFNLIDETYELRGGDILDDAANVNDGHIILTKLCTVDYSFNGVDANEELPDSVTGYWYENSYTVTDLNPTNEEWIFKNWNTQSNGKGQSVLAGYNGVILGDTTLYAQWQYDEQFSVVVPKQIVLDSDFTSDYEVEVYGRMLDTRHITVTPDSEFTMKYMLDTGEVIPDVKATVTQSKTEWLSTDIAMDACSSPGNGTILCGELVDGLWSGIFNFSITIEDIGSGSINTGEPIEIIITPDSISLDSIVIDETDNMVLSKISDVPLAYEQVAAFNVEMKATVDGEPISYVYNSAVMEEEGMPVDSMIVNYPDEGVSMAYLFVISVQEDTTFDGIPLTKGVWTLLGPDYINLMLEDMENSEDAGEMPEDIQITFTFPPLVDYTELNQDTEAELIMTIDEEDGLYLHKLSDAVMTSETLKDGYFIQYMHGTSTAEDGTISEVEDGLTISFEDILADNSDSSEIVIAETEDLKGTYIISEYIYL